MLPTLSSWNPDHMTARTFELATLVGPFCRLSTFPEEVRVTEAYFTNPQKRSQADIDSAINSLRGTIQGIQKTLYRIFRNIVHASPAARGEVLNYFATAIRLNEKRAQMAVDPSTVGTDGFLTNLVTILLKLSEPFMDAEYSKIDRIDPEYFRKSNRINISQETKIKATQQEAEAYYKHPPTDAQAPNFISEIFFLNIAMHHYGLLRTFANYNNFIKDLSDIQKQIERLKEGRPQWSGTPLAMVNENLLKLRETEFEKMLSQKLAFDCQLMDPSLLTHSLRFYNLVMTWILRMVDPERKYPKEQIRLPLPENPPEAFVMLPEYFIEDITEYFLFIAKYAPHIIVQNSSRELIDFIIVFLKSSSYVKNPYLKARLVEILFYFTLPFRGYPNGGLGNQLNQYQMSLEYLMTALMSFYVEVEQTGAHTQFYDKFNIRYNISQVFKCIRVHHTHRDKLKEESRNNMDSFVRFANLLMNDATFLLDESLTKLAEIYNIQTEMDKEEWKSKPQQYRQERESLLQSLERQVTSYLTLGDETVGMLQYMSAEVAEPFLTPQIVDRLAAMLDYNLVTLVGPKCTELRVKEPEKYRFSRDGLLKQIIDIFLNLCNHKEFIQAVSRDGRSYSREIFLEANNRMRDLKTQSETNIRKFSIFVNKVEEAFKRDAEGEEELGEIPEEFLDPVMYDIMEDPVILPTSRTIVDRSTIATHLLSDSKDPFNRKPLKIEDVIPATELKERIEAFKAEKRKKSSDPPVTPYRI
ncbi:6693_t:CDS:10 [Paraglomus occultum]|uniref:RING-type E3 ubiquitin transferase n=1 Tax=Paraglomus occultum TaxID=144539 RepID=A0A9N9BHR1_9GLOM|nr:6693_t:CDS:10 [Paraglomus occultum]